MGKKIEKAGAVLGIASALFTGVKNVTSMCLPSSDSKSCSEKSTSDSNLLGKLDFLTKKNKKD